MAALAATVVLLRDATDGPEVLLLERPSNRGSFRGAWVFPGGAVDAGDFDIGSDDGTAAAAASAVRRAAVRETVEETGLVIDPGALVALSRWHPPPEAQKQLVTSFFAAPAPDGIIGLNEVEAVASRWMAPSAALAAHGAGSLLLFPPTWVTLHGLLGAASVDDALMRAGSAGPVEFRTRFTRGATLALWEPDEDYGAAVPTDTATTRHRLDIAALPWTYERTGG